MRKANTMLDKNWECTATDLVEIMTEIVIDLLAAFAKGKLHLANHKGIFQFKVD